MNKTDRKIDQLCRDVIVLDSDSDEAPSLEKMAKDAREILEARKPRPRPSRPSPESVRHNEAVKGREEEATRERCREEYEKVRVRSGDRCELTGAVGHPSNPLVTHHIFYGRGVDRDAVTWAHLMIRVRDSVHKQIHNDPTIWGDEMRLWAAALGFTNARNEIARRAERCRATRAKENA